MAGVEPKAEDLALYIPWVNIAVFCEDFRYSDQLIPMGKVESGQEVFDNLEGEIEFLVKLIKKFSEKYPAVQFELYNEMADNVKDRVDKEESHLNIIAYYTLLSNVVLIVEEGMGCAVCLDGALAICHRPGGRFIPLLPERTTRSVLLWKKNRMF